MEGLAPTLQLCIEVRMLLERGEALYVGLKKILPQMSAEVRKDLLRIIFQFEQRGEIINDFETQSLYRKEVFRIIGAGLLGEPIASRLKEVEVEIESVCADEIEVFVAALPLRAMLPILLMQFPAFLILVFSPIVTEITRSFTQ